ncbi:hypothetical protein TrVE_jg13489 [Triparma verrucosa]|uniref:Uncharacterized protein n=1 Tax=Triparma verrucosa TaxID=1606542 RepID=A0A9W7BAV4_9STRA|nr:hypothetical protein TrVE_jg13489 [Triparma verrucosa]
MSNQESDYYIEPLNVLSFPKGKAPKCELTGYPATCKLQSPEITLFYATREHAEQAWHGIINKIAGLLGPLRSNAVIVGSEEDRAKREYTVNMSKRALIDLCQQEASKMLVNQQYSLAIPGAIQALAFLKDIYGDGSIESVPPYLLLAEANLGLSKFQQCEEFLSLANWSILKNPNCSDAIRSQLHRNFGKLYTAQDKLDEALKELAKDIYHSSLEVGPEHIDTSGGFFHMANIFYIQNKIDNALAFYDKVVDVWYKFLGLVRNNAELAETFSEAQLREGIEMLEKIMQTRVKLLGDAHIATGEVKYTVGLLYLFLGERDKANSYVQAAASVYKDKLGEKHPSTLDVASVAEQIQNESGMMSRGGISTAGRSGAGSAGGVPIGIQSGGVEGMEGFAELSNAFPEDMPRAATQSPIPLPPGSSRGQSRGGFDDSMRMTPSGSRGKV